jgi:hypothetical protein
MHRETHSSGVAGAVAIIMIGLAVAMGWLLFSGGVFGGANGDAVLSGPLADTEIATAAPAALVEGMRIESAVQFSQPRDPFRPLITETAVAGGGGGGGSGGVTNGSTVTLQEINEVDGILRATVVVDGVTYIVGVGDTFAGTFQVVSLDADSGVFLNGDNAFELSVGQQILK